MYDTENVEFKFSRLRRHVKVIKIIMKKFQMQSQQTSRYSGHTIEQFSTALVRNCLQVRQLRCLLSREKLNSTLSASHI